MSATPALHKTVIEFRTRRLLLSQRYHLAYHFFHDELAELSNLIKRSRLYSEALALRESWRFWNYPKVPTIAILSTGVALSLLYFNGAFSEKAKENSGFQFLNVGINFAIQFVGEKLFRFVYTKVHSCWLNRHLAKMKSPESDQPLSQAHRNELIQEYKLAKETEIHLLGCLSGLEALKSAQRAFYPKRQIHRKASHRYLDFVRRQILIQGLAYLPEVIALAISVGVEFLAPQWKDIKLWEAAVSTSIIALLTGISWATPTFLLEAINGFAGWFKSDGCLMQCFRRCTCQSIGEEAEAHDQPATFGCSEAGPPAQFLQAQVLAPQQTPALHQHGPSASTNFLDVLSGSSQGSYGATGAGASMGSGGGASIV